MPREKPQDLPARDAARAAISEAGWVRASSECTENGCQLGYLAQITERAVIAEAQAEALAEALVRLKRDVEDSGSPRRHQAALARSERVLDAFYQESSDAS